MTEVECYSPDEQWLHDGLHLHEAAELLVASANGTPHEAIKRFWTHVEMLETYGVHELWYELNELTSQYSLDDVVRMTGVPYHRLYYAFCTGQIPEPKRVGRNRIYTVKDVQKIKEHFAAK